MTSVVAPICIACTRMRADGSSCDAFPHGVPNAILSYRHDHREPYRGDHGLTFDPLTPEDAAWADQMVEMVRSTRRTAR